MDAIRDANSRLILRVARPVHNSRDIKLVLESGSKDFVSISLLSHKIDQAVLAY